MTTKSQTVAGTTISISAALPTTYDATGFGALSYSAIAEVTDIGTYGREYTKVTFNPLADRNTYKFRGSFDSGNLDLKLGKTTLANVDAGQVLLTTASQSDADFSFKIVLQDGSKAYFTAKVMSFTTAVSSVNNILMGECKVEITSLIVESAT